MRKRHTVHIDSDKCVGCGLCRKDCPVNNIIMQDKKAKVLTQTCIMCGHCVAVCPKAAVSMTGFDEPPVEIEGPTRLDPRVLAEAIRSRRSIRQFSNRPVAPDAISQIIEAGRLTPTGGNVQDVSFIVLEDKLKRAERMAVHAIRRLLPLVRMAVPMARRIEVDGHFFFKKAPAAVMVVARDKVDGALAASNMALMAEACGLGVLYSGFFTHAANHLPSLRRKLGLGRGRRVVATLVIGYPAVKYRRTAPKETASVRLM